VAAALIAAELDDAGRAAPHRTDAPCGVRSADGIWNAWIVLEVELTIADVTMMAATICAESPVGCLNIMIVVGLT